MYNVLWLASWYPSKVDSFAGDFIERHSFAVGSFVKLTVLFIVKDETMERGQSIVEKIQHNNHVVYKVYYGRSSSNSLLERILSYRTYRQLQKKMYKQIVSEIGKPDLLHVHVAMKGGMLAGYLKRKFMIPYFVTEHWSGYFKESAPNVYTGNWVINNQNKKVLNNANLLLPVTQNLGNTINKNFTNVKYVVIPNVVNTDLFFYKPFQPKKFRFIHPSSMDDNKNPKGILMACKKAKVMGCDFELLMVGKLDNSILEVAKQLDLSKDFVTFKPAISYAEVAKEMQHSSALLLFSGFESLPCVILEALCCGLPVISSRVGGIDEVIDNENGILVESGKVEELAVAICKMIENYADYNRHSIAQKAAQKFSYGVVGQQYFDQYKRLLNP